MVLRNPVEVWQNVLVFDPGVAGIWALEVHIEDMASVFPKADYVRLEFYAAAEVDFMSIPTCTTPSIRATALLMIDRVIG